jgi:hypothetical protein
VKYLLAVLSVTLVLLSPLANGASTKIGDLQFSNDFDSLMAAAQQSQKYIVIDWFTDW